MADSWLVTPGSILHACKEALVRNEHCQAPVPNWHGLSGYAKSTTAGLPPQRLAVGHFNWRPFSFLQLACHHGVCLLSASMGTTSKHGLQQMRPETCDHTGCSSFQWRAVGSSKDSWLS
eukprot:1151247-Pelagomonas_calceolata.AAC.1